MHDSWSMKETCKLLIKKFFITNFTPIHKILKVCNKEFT